MNIKDPAMLLLLLVMVPPPTTAYLDSALPSSPLHCVGGGVGGHSPLPFCTPASSKHFKAY